MSTSTHIDVVGESASRARPRAEVEVVVAAVAEHAVRRVEHRAAAVRAEVLVGPDLRLRVERLRVGEAEAVEVRDDVRFLAWKNERFEMIREIGENFIKGPPKTL